MGILPLMLECSWWTRNRPTGKTCFISLNASSRNISLKSRDSSTSSPNPLMRIGVRALHPVQNCDLSSYITVNFSDMQSTSKGMLDEIRAIRRSLQSNFQDKNDGYARKMFRFAAVAEEELQEVRDGIVHAEKSLRDVQTYFGEGEEMGRPLPSQDFFGIFRTFTSSWKVS